MANLKQSEADAAEAPKSAGVEAAAAPVSSLIPRFADACALLQTPYSCLVMETHRRHVALPPVYLKKKRSGIQDELNTELLKYSSSLKGVPLAYDDIKVVGQHGDIHDDQGYIHLNIEASFVIFKPRKGQMLVGVINKIGVGHVGCLVHGCFNASVVKPAQLTPEQWRDSGLKLGGSLEFEVFQLDTDVAGVLLIRGRLERSRVQELVASFNITETEPQGSEVVTEPDSASVQLPEDGSVSKSKKKKKDKHKDGEETKDTTDERTAETVTCDVYGNGTETDSNSNCVTKEKKKKKKKDKRQETAEELPSPTELPNSDSSGYVSEKASRKRKQQEDEGLQDESAMSVPKKKKKHK